MNIPSCGPKSCIVNRRKKIRFYNSLWPSKAQHYQTKSYILGFNGYWEWGEGKDQDKMYKKAPQALTVKKRLRNSPNQDGNNPGYQLQEYEWQG